jgi:hypothetical protein
MDSIAPRAASISTTQADLNAALVELEAHGVDMTYDRKLLDRAALRDRQGQHRKAQNLRKSIAYDIAREQLVVEQEEVTAAEIAAWGRPERYL